MSPRYSTSAVSAFILLVLASAVLLFPIPASAQTGWTLWGPNQWFDWSDYRLRTGASVFFPRLVSGTLNDKNLGQEYDLLGPPPPGSIGYDLKQDPAPFVQGWFELYVDRLGLRLHLQSATFDGHLNSTVWQEVPKLNLSSARVGSDLDLYRSPAMALGVNVDYDLVSTTFKSKRVTPPPNTPPDVDLSGQSSLTVGVHGRAIPIRLRDVPVTVQGRFRYPVWWQEGRARTMEWEVLVGLRPAIWDTSFISHSTFSASIEAGFRSTNLEFQDGDFKLKAHWQGPFIGLTLYY